MNIRIADTELHIEHDRIDGDIRGKIERYMSGERVIFDETVGLGDFTSFQQRVLSSIRSVAYGETVTYAELAERVGNHGAARAAANACGVNPVPVVIPCHRIVATNGVGGYRYGATVKSYLLQLESSSSQS